MRILIVGGSGYLGGRIVEYLSKLSTYQIRVGSRSSNFQKVKKSEFITFNWDSKQSLESICEGMDLVIHAAGRNAGECSENTEGALEVNGIYTIRLLNAAIEKRVKRIIYFSTAHIYGSPLCGIITEKSCANSLHPYATSHRAGEDAVRYAQQQNRIEGIVIRLSNSFGPPVRWDNNCWMLFVNDICWQALKNGKIIIHSSGLQRRDFVPLSEVCKATNHILSLPTRETLDCVFNLGSGISMTLLEMAAIVAERVRLITRKQVHVEAESSDSIEDFKFSVEKLTSSGFNFKFMPAIIKEIDMLINFCLKEL